MANRPFTRKNLTSTGKLIFDFITEFVRTEGYAPSVREICDATGIRSTSTVHSHLQRLRDSGRLEVASGRRRAISLGAGTGPAPRTFEIPLLGAVAAGVPILAEQNVERYVEFPVSFVPQDAESFLLTVKGDSMRDAGILSGDLVLVRRQSQASPGEIVVALVGDEATVKVLSREGDSYVLMPRNPAYAPIPVTDDTRILGRVVRLVRAL
jgi:repressor LexA